MRAADFKQLKVHVAMLKPSSLAFVVVAAAALELNARVAAEPSGSTQAPRPAVVAKICPAGTPGVREKYRLPPPARLPDGISFATDWERLASGGWFGQQIMDRCRMQPDGARAGHGKTAVRVEVQPNDELVISLFKASVQRGDPHPHWAPSGRGLPFILGKLYSCPGHTAQNRGRSLHGECVAGAWRYYFPTPASYFGSRVS